MSSLPRPFEIKGPMVEAPLQFRLSSGGSMAKSDSFIICPKCEAPGFIRKSDRITVTTKHLICHCTDSACGHVWKAEVAFIHSLVEGNIDRPDLDLPVCPREEVVHVRPPARDGPDDNQIGLFGSG